MKAPHSLGPLAGVSLFVCLFVNAQGAEIIEDRSPDGKYGLQEEDDEKLIKGAPFPAGFGVVKSSLSPDGRYGVLAPDWDHYEDGQPQNKLVEVKTGRVLAVIKAETGLVRMNHGGILPSRWSSDGLFLLWHVDGKWSPRALVLLKVDKGEVKWQRDLLKLAQQEILARTRKAVLRKYAAARKRNAGLSDEAYPGGMTIINVVTEGEEDAPLVLPVTINAELESNPKAIEESPKSTEVNSEMHAKIDAEGKFSVKDFHLE